MWGHAAPKMHHIGRFGPHNALSKRTEPPGFHADRDLTKVSVKPKIAHAAACSHPGSGIFAGSEPLLLQISDTRSLERGGGKARLGARGHVGPRSVGKVPNGSTPEMTRT